MTKVMAATPAGFATIAQFRYLPRRLRLAAFPEPRDLSAEPRVFSRRLRSGLYAAVGTAAIVATTFTMRSVNQATLTTPLIQPAVFSTSVAHVNAQTATSLLSGGISHKTEVPRNAHEHAMLVIAALGGGREATPTQIDAVDKAFASAARRLSPRRPDGG
jgi:hypothetical protein